MRKFLIALLGVFLAFNCLGQISKKLIATYNKAVEYQNKNDYENAVKYYLKFCDKHPFDYQARYNLGNCYSVLSEYKLAIEQYNIAESIRGDEPDLYESRGASHSHQGNYDKALKDFKKTYELTGHMTDILAFAMGNNFWMSERYDSALFYFDISIKLNPKRHEAHSNIGYVHMIMENYEEAKSAYFYTLQLDSNDYRSLNNLGYIYLKLGDLDNAKKYVNKSLSINSENSWVYRNLGLISKEEGDKKSACGYYKQAIDMGFGKVWGIKNIQELKEYCD